MAYVAFTEEQFNALDDFLTELAQGGQATLVPKNITENGTYDPADDDADGYSEVTVDVSSGESADPKDVNFIDYDGTIVYSYTKAEFMALTAMPENPTHAGLVSQGWNWSLADAQEYVGKYGIHTIGQMYATESGATEIDIVLHEGRLSPYLSLAPNGTVTIDWGDGSATDTLTGTSLTTREGIQHSYAAAGAYTISVHVVSGSVALYCTPTYTLLYKDSTANDNRVYSNCVQAVRIGASASIGVNAFSNCYSLSSVTVPSGVTSIGTYAFDACYSLSSVTVPSGVTSIGTYAFRYCQSLPSVAIPSGVTSIDASAFSSCYSLSSVTVPSSVTRIGSNVFSSCQSLSSVTITDSVTSIDASAFTGCLSLPSVTIPSGVTSIGTSAFSNCFGLGEIHFLPTTPPTVSNSNAWTRVPTDCTIYVPQGSLAAYTSAANYPSASTYTYVEE